MHRLATATRALGKPAVARESTKSGLGKVRLSRLGPTSKGENEQLPSNEAAANRDDGEDRATVASAASGSDQCSEHVASLVCTRDISAVDHLVRESTKDAAACEKCCELQSTPIVKYPNAHGGLGQRIP